MSSASQGSLTKDVLLYVQQSVTLGTAAPQQLSIPGIPLSHLLLL